MNWRAGSWKTAAKTLRYTVPIAVGYTITDCLAVVFKKNDGRWGWIRKRSDFLPCDRLNPIEGVSATQELAQERALADLQFMAPWGLFENAEEIS